MKQYPTASCLQKPESQSRREFLKFFGTVATAIGLEQSMGPLVLEALAAPGRPPVLWLHFAECTGCTESVLRTTTPWLDDLIFNSISLDYHETVMASAGNVAEDILANAAVQYAGEFFCVVEGSVPTANSGTFGMIGNRSMLSIAKEICPKARAVIAIGTCSSFGGLAAAAPNPTGARGVDEALGNSFSVPLIKIPGCPPNPVSFVGTLANYVLKGALPPLDSLRRPIFAYGTRVHDRCPYHEDAMEYRCLEDIGCKGKVCWNNCPTVKFNDATSWPVQAGHPCIGCSQPGFWDTMTPFYAEVDD